jgi:hypothetical protein
MHQFNGSRQTFSYGTDLEQLNDDNLLYNPKRLDKEALKEYFNHIDLQPIVSRHLLQIHHS